MTFPQETFDEGDKLKTLKDMENSDVEIAAEGENVIGVNELRTEAIKWIKSEMPKKEEDIKDRIAVNKWIIIFFNIMEKEIK